MWNTNDKEMSQLGGVLTGVSLTLTFDLRGQIVSWEWEARLSWNEREGSGYDALMWNTKEMSQPDAALTGVPFNLSFDLQGQIVSREWEARL